MNTIYTQSVSNVPEDYTQPTPNYKKHVYIAVAGIVAFFGLYLFLTYWFFSAAYRLLMDVFSGGEAGLMHILVGAASLFLGIFMIKAFFFVQTKYDVKDREVKPADEPLLFDFLYKLADEIGAPRPNKVYLSNRVNASVFYDLSFLNLFFPSKKNLEIGLGLINVLNLGEFKAVLAHEYGHFAQRSMLVGRWVYIANQIAVAVIAKRDALDAFLAGLSRIDIRIAWIGWILSIIVWSIRSLVELIFRVVVLSQRALSREMEFQADLVAVSVTGSDALIHALHKLQAADAALSSAMQTLGRQLEKEKAIEDLYSIQTNAIEKTAYILNDDTYGKSPNVPEESPETFRVFSDKIAQPPQMWSTHPPDQEREENAKRHYIQGFIDDRSAWDLFKDPKGTRVLLTEDLVKTTEVKAEIISETEAIQSHNLQYEKSFFKPQYKGVYLGRFIYEDYTSSEDIYLTDMSDEEVVKELQDLYPDSLVEDLEDFTTLRSELHQLEAIKDKRLQATGEGGIWHRGTPLRRSELPDVIKGVSQELEDAKSIITTQDKVCRTVHLKLAEKLGNNWDEYLKSLGKVIHYCEHNAVNLGDAHRVLGTTLNIVMADNNVSNKEMRKLLIACNDLHEILENLNAHRNDIRLDERLLKELNVDSWADALEELQIPRANQENINGWIQSISSWVESYDSSLHALRSEALEVLLTTEEELVAIQKSGQVHAAPAPTEIDVTYDTLLPGEEREVQMKLSLWDKFVTADGIVPAITKFAVAASIVGGTVFMAGTTGMSDVTIYNGLSQAVSVDMNGSNVKVQPHSSRNISIGSTADFSVNTYLAKDGSQIDQLTPKLSGRTAHYVYNVAGAAVLNEYETYYSDNPSNTPEGSNTILGATKWIQTKADYIFTDPPETIETSKTSGTVVKTALQAISPDVNPAMLMTVLNEKDQKSIIEAHVLHDPLDENTVYWTDLARQLDGGTTLLNNRLKHFPNEVETVRMLMESGDESKKAVCEEYTEKALKAPDNPDLKYIACRCIDDQQAHSTCFKEAAAKWTDHSWLNYGAAYAYTQEGAWEESYKAYQKAYQSSTVKEGAAINLERIGRLLAYKGSNIPLNENVESNYLSYIKTIESGTDQEPSYYAYHLIDKGKLEDARKLVADQPDIQKNIYILTAASDGAKKEWISAALSAGTDDLDGDALIAITGLYLRKGKNTDKFKKQLENTFDGEDININDFMDAVKTKNYTKASELIKAVSTASKGQLATIAYVAHGSKVPKHWKDYIKYLLFATEKPYVK